MAVQVQKIYPTVEQCMVNNTVKCTERNCTSVFTSESNLLMHLVKTHNKGNLTRSNMKKLFFCPSDICIYNEHRHFNSLKDLRQHYLKVHADKEYTCITCSKCFSSEKKLKHHEEFCGISFKCYDCAASYPCYETLRTHCRRKHHNIFPKSSYKVVNQGEILVLTASNGEYILKSPLHLDRQTKMLSHQESQTRAVEKKLKSKMTQVNRIYPTLLQNTQHTQTGSKNVLLTVHTQTVGDSLDVSNKVNPEITRKSSNTQTDTVEAKNSSSSASVTQEYCGPNSKEITRKSSDTQTDMVESRSTSCNTSFNLEDFEFDTKERSSNYTQTLFEAQNSIFSASTSTHYSIHTDTSDLIPIDDNLSSLDNFFNCNIETQTDFEMLQDSIFGSDVLRGLELTDNQTQTVFDSYNLKSQKCQELGNFGLTDNETQTAFHELLKSVESQTMMSHIKKVDSCGMHTMETQTDSELRKMLELINS